MLAARRDDENSHEHGHGRGDAHDWLGAAGSCCDVHVVCATFGQAQSFDVTACWNQIATKIADRLSRRHNASQWTSSTKRRCLGAAWGLCLVHISEPTSLAATTYAVFFSTKTHEHPRRQ